MALLRRLLPLAACLLATPLSAQVVRGKVLDAATAGGVPEVEVRALSEGREVGRARTAADGSFRMQLRVAATVRIEAQRTGYRPTVTPELPVGTREAVDVEVRLSASAVTIEPLRVTARAAPPRRQALERNGVYQRQQRGVGRFLFREDIERFSNMNLGHVLSHVSGTRVVRTGRNDYIVFTRAMASFSTARGPGCLPKLYLDGSRMSYGGGMDINSIVSPEQVEAVELYGSAAEIPAEYNGSDAACGVILIWTRREP
ncbi:MAG: TonB-dependent receptor [Longimicrobiaceae bacterium]